MSEMCGEETAEGTPCENSACRPDGKCWIHTEVGEPADVGRDSKLTRERQEQIAQAIEQGKSLTSAARMAGISRTAVYAWLEKGEDQDEGVYAEFHDSIQQTKWHDKRGKYNAGDSRVEVECDICSTPKLVYPYKLEKYNKYYCDKHHPSARGQNSPNWKEDSRSYMGPNWGRQRKRALERDNYKCQSCGIHDEEHRKKWDHGVHVHHIIARSEFEEMDKEQNDLGNLVTLCRDCHQAYEGCNLSPVHRVNA